MKFIKKKAVLPGFVLILFLAVWIYFVYDINAAYPSPKNYEYKEGETFEYYGLKVTPKEIEVFDYDEFCQKIEGFRDYSEGDEVFENSIYFLAHIHVENPAKEDKIFKFADISTWMLEVDNCSNGMSDDLAYLVDYSDDIYKAGSNMDIVLPYYLYKENIRCKTKEELLQHDIKIVAKYYPKKEYIYYESED